MNGPGAIGPMTSASPASRLKLALKRRLARLSSALAHRHAGSRVLLYHSISGGPQSIDESTFRDQMVFIAANQGFTTLDDALSSVPLEAPRGSMAITFDDGYATLADVARAILAAAGAPATAYICTAEIGNQRRPSQSHLGHLPGETFLTWADVGALRGAGWTIGSHGCGHFDFTRLSPVQAGEEITKSKAEISARLGEACHHLAYPWGRWSSSIRESVIQAGYHSAAGGYHGVLTSSSDRFAFPRIAVDPHWNRDDFAAVLRGDWDYLGWLQLRMQRKA